MPHAYMHTCTHAHTCTYMHIHAHTCTYMHCTQVREVSWCLIRLVKELEAKHKDERTRAARTARKQLAMVASGHQCRACRRLYASGLDDVCPVCGRQAMGDADRSCGLPNMGGSLGPSMSDLRTMMVPLPLPCVLYDECFLEGHVASRMLASFAGSGIEWALNPHIHAHALAHAHAHTHTCTCTCTPMHMHTHTHTCTQVLHGRSTLAVQTAPPPSMATRGSSITTSTAMRPRPFTGGRLLCGTHACMHIHACMRVHACTSHIPTCIGGRLLCSSCGLWSKHGTSVVLVGG